MTSTSSIVAHRWWKPLRILRVRWRLFLAGLVALGVFALLPSDWRLINRILIGWDVGVMLYLALAVELAMGTDTNHMRRRCVLYDEGRVAIPVLTVTAALASIGAIFVQLTTAPAGHHFLKPRICGGDYSSVMELYPGYLRLSLRTRVLCGASGASRWARLSR